MTLFDTGFERTSLERIRVGQSAYDWLNRSAKPEAASGRAALERMFAQYPEAAKHEFRARFTAKDDDVHESTVFELYLFALFKAMGFHVEPNPCTRGGSRPEFLIKFNERSWLVEAKTDLGMDRVTHRRQVIDTLIQQATALIRVPGFGVLVRDCAIGQHNPVPRRLAAFLNRWFRDENHADRRAGYLRAEAMPERVFDDPETGWRLHMSLWPLETAENVLTSVAGSTGFQSEWVDSQGRVLQAVRDKCKQHASADLPLIVAFAANDLMTEPDGDDLLSALVGTSEECFVNARRRDSVWADSRLTPVNQPAGVIYVERCYPWSLARVRPVLFDNPWCADHTRLSPWPLARVSWELPEGRIVARAGQPASELLPL